MSQEAFEAIEQEATPTLTVSLSLEGIGLSLINRSIIEVVYLSARGLKVEYMNSNVSQSVDLSIGHLQVDNQLPEATFNVVFQPTPISRQGAPKLPTVQASVVILNDRCESSDVYRMFSNSKHSVWCLVH
jgi:vacuolar protein sorting-associated protein 13A/C